MSSLPAFISQNYDSSKGPLASCTVRYPAPDMRTVQTGRYYSIFIRNAMSVRALLCREYWENIQMFTQHVAWLAVVLENIENRRGISTSKVCRCIPEVVCGGQFRFGLRFFDSSRGNDKPFR